MKTVKLPKFKLAGELTIYESGDIVRNGGPFSPITRKYQQDMYIGLDWFRKNNAAAYMVLLD